MLVQGSPRYDEAQSVWESEPEVTRPLYEPMYRGDWNNRTSNFQNHYCATKDTSSRGIDQGGKRK